MYKPVSSSGHLLSSGKPPDREYRFLAASIDGASVDHTVSSWSPITHRPAPVLETRIKENPDVSCYQPRGQGHCVLFTLSHDSAPSSSRLFQAVKIGITSYYWMLWWPALNSGLPFEIRQLNDPANMPLTSAHDTALHEP